MKSSLRPLPFLSGELLPGPARVFRDPVPPIQPDWINRDAQLFEAGDFPDKGVTVTPEDLAKMAANFERPVPVLIEHSGSPLELGFLTEVRAEGNDLFGTITLSPEADALIRKNGATALSLGLSQDLQEIREVSLVRHPRVQKARLFRKETRREDDELIRSYLSRGKLLPSQVPFAEALLTTEGSVEFKEGLVPVRQLVTEILDRMPPLALFAELAPVPSTQPHSLLLPEEEAFYKRYFPEVSLDEIAQRKH